MDGRPAPNHPEVREDLWQFMLVNLSDLPHQSTVEIEKTLSELPSTPDSISYLEFRTLLIMFETGDINPTPPCVTKFFDERPTDIVDGLARYLYLTTYFFCIFMMAPTISTYPSNADQ
ncbi:unnamed protein product [Prorocentrum cordatum]|uniref:Uncharacterized protein n=1 Tax=Prorocentrum cordatum TaxID=2364126 RepID=A0ABN9WN00_9DINO|nr:unnamed protein product [Polarella glacialis]